MYKVAIRNNKTGEIRLYEQELEWHEASEFWWEEGNMSCDCNRHTCFEMAGGKEYEEVEDIKCGEGKYDALYAIVDGKKIYFVN